jgi:phytanoyl-CoA hydroxylase
LLGLRNPFKKHKGRRWQFTQADLPWYDQPNALKTLEERRKAEGLSDAEFESLRKWVTDGYFVVDGTIDIALIDGMSQDLDDLWSATEAKPELIVCDVRTAPDATPRSMKHEELIAFPVEQRQQMKIWSHWRVHEFFRWSANCDAIHSHKEFVRIASMIFGRPGEAEYTINFAYGSRQSLHQDSGVFHLFPPNFLAGMWLACEDIVPEAGPLVYYPGSHKEPFFPKFDNYPQTNLKTAPKDQIPEYYAYVEKLAEKYERKQFLAKKGQALFWQGMLIHGGDAVTDPTRTRNSYVCHYVPPGVKQDQNVVGPFNW